MDRAEELNRLAETLLGYVSEGATDLSDDVFFVPSAHYWDPARWSLEIETIFKRLPLMLAFTAELPNPGDFKTMEVLDQPILITRGRDGEARAFLNVCTHRGSPVVEQERGTATRFSCRYHGWTFRNDGKLLGVTDAGKFGDFDKNCRDLTALPCEEKAGLIFVIMTPGLPIDVKTFLGGMLDDLANYGFEHWSFYDRREIFGGNWKIAFDGYLENYHFNTLHTKTIAPRSIGNTMEFTSSGPHMRIAFPSAGIAELNTLPRDRWWTKELVCFRAVRTIFPNVSISLAHGIGQISQIIPGPTPDKNRTILNYLAPRPPKDADEDKTYSQARDFYRDVTNDEDYVLGLKIQKGLQTSAIPSVVFGKNERGNQHFHKWVEYYVSGGAQPKPDEL